MRARLMAKNTRDAAMITAFHVVRMPMTPAASTAREKIGDENASRNAVAAGSWSNSRRRCHGTTIEADTMIRM